MIPTKYNANCFCIKRVCFSFVIHGHDGHLEFNTETILAIYCSATKNAQFIVPLQ